MKWSWIIAKEMREAKSLIKRNEMTETHEHKFEKWEPVIVNGIPVEQMSRCECGSISIKPLADK